MIKNKFFLLFLLFFLHGSPSLSQNIAYANLDLIIKKSEVGKKIITHFNEKNKILIDNFKQNQKKLKEKENELISQKNILEADEYTKKVDVLKKEINIFNVNNNKKINDINIKKDKVSKSFLNEINLVIKDFAESNKIDIIISSKHMLIGKSSLDVTEDILKDVNKKIKKFKIE